MKKIRFGLLAALFGMLTVWCGFAQAEKLELPASVTVIEAEAFYGDQSLDEVVLPEGIKRIEELAFASSSVKKVNLPDSLEYIADNAFDKTSGISVTANAGSEAYDWAVENGFIDRISMPGNANDFTFFDNGNGTATVIGYVGEVSSDIIIPSYDSKGNIVVEIGVGAFRSRKELKGNLIIPKTVVKIGDHAFEGCTGLYGKLTIPDSVLTIGDSAFRECSGFTGELKLSSSLKTINEATFYGCYSLSGMLTIPNEVTVIRSDAFAYCRGLTGLSLSSSLTNIRSGSFSYCTGLTGDLKIPDSVEEIGESAFRGCLGLTGKLDLGHGVTKIGGSAFMECSGFSGDLIIPDSVNTIGSSAFQSCGFDGKLILSKNINTIESSTFKQCWQLTGELSIPDGVSAIGWMAFAYDSKLTGALTVPESVIDVGEYAFYECSGFDGSLSLSDNVKSIGKYAFSGCSLLSGEISIPKNLQIVCEGTFKNCSNLVGNLKLPEKLTIIEPEAFYACSGLTGDLIIPDTVMQIGYSAFYGCSGFDGTLKLSNNITRIENHVFYECKSFAGQLTIPEKVVLIDQFAFFDCENFEDDLIIPDSVETIGQYAFGYCRNMKGELQLPELIENIGSCAFISCGFTGQMNIPRNLKSIGAYGGCDGFTGNLLIPNGAQFIEQQAFYGCSGIDGYLLVPESIQYIGANAFYGCNEIKAIYCIPDSYAWNWFSKYSTYKSKLVEWDGVTIPDEDNPTFGDSTYKIFHNNLTWKEAAAACEALGGHLITITSQAEQEFINSLNTDNLRLWIGAHTDDQNTWHWVTGEEWNYTHWGDGEPNNSSNVISNENRVAVWPDFWNDLNGNNTSETDGYICEWDGKNSQDVSFTLKKREIVVGEILEIEVSAPGATEVQLIVDGKYYETYQLNSGKASIERRITKMGQRSITFRANRDDGWTEAAEAQTVSVTGFGKLDSPTLFTVEQYIETGNDVMIKWNHVQNADGYQLYVYSENERFDFIELNPETDTEGNLCYVINNAYVSECGTYSGLLMAYGYGYSQSEYAFTFSITTNQSDDETDIHDLIYEIVDGSYVVIQGSTQKGGQLVIPDTIDGYPVREIAAKAFYGRDDLTGRLLLPHELESIGDCAFAYCENISGILELPSTLKDIGVFAFGWCKKISGELTIPGGVNTISTEAFHNCISITRLYLNEGTRMIGDEAFLSCTNLSGIIAMPSTIEAIGHYAFTNCGDLTLQFPLNDPVYLACVRAGYNAVHIKESDQYTGPLTYEIVDDYVIITGTNQMSGELIIPESIGGKIVRKIANDAFNYNENITGDLYIPGTVTEIGDYAFYHCSGLCGNLFIENGLITIGMNAFNNCNFIGDLIIPDSVETIGENAFESNATFQFTGKLYLGKGLKNIGRMAFTATHFRKNLIIPANVVWVGEYAFAHMYGIESFYIENMNATFEKDAFYKYVDSPYAHEQKYYVKRMSTAYDFFNNPNLNTTGLQCEIGLPIQLDAADVTMEVGDSFEIHPIIVDELSSINDIEWTSSDSLIASVDAAGSILACKPGTVTITATLYSDLGESSAKCTVKVFEEIEHKVRLLSISESTYYGETLSGNITHNRKIHEIFSKGTSCGYSIVSQKYYENIGAEETMKQISSIAAVATENDVTVFVLCCHGTSGVPDGSTYEGSFALTDGILSYRITTTELLQALNKVKGKVIVILSSCGSGSLIKKAKTLSYFNDKYTILTSQEALIEEVASVQTGSVFLDLLNEAVWSADDGDGEITSIELNNYFRNVVDITSGINPQVAPLDEYVLFSK